MAEPKRPIRKLRKRVAEQPAAEPQEPKQRTRRRTLPPGVKATPYWKAAGGGPPSVRYAAETEETAEEETD